MKIIKFFNGSGELPMDIHFSLDPLFKDLEKAAADKDHPFHHSSKKILESASKFPDLKSGIADFSNLAQYSEAIEMLTEPLFPTALQSNEIKAMMIPFRYLAFRPTARFRKILNNAGKDYKLRLPGMDDENFYIMACSFILAKYYHQPFHFSRPLYAQIPDQKSGIERQYRLLINADFASVIKTDKAKELTQEDINELLASGEDVELWKKKFPSNSYIFKGFGIMNLYDATIDVTISKLRSLFIGNDRNVFREFQENLRVLFGVNDLRLGYSMYDTSSQSILSSFLNKEAKSLFLSKHEEGGYRQIFCEGVNREVMQLKQTLAIPDVDVYSKKSGQNNFSKKLKANGIGSIILAPIHLENGFIQLIELASADKNKLNSLNAVKLTDILPFVKIAAERSFEERANMLESAIQENYTTLHPSVKWRFSEAANQFLRQKAQGVEMPVPEEIVFDNIYPLYGQSDIKSSSEARNNAIRADLIHQLSLVIDTFKKVRHIQPMPIYNKLVFRVSNYLEAVRDGLHAGDEVGILEFLKMEIYPVFNHLKTLGPAYQDAVEAYIQQIDPQLNVVYNARKSYEESVTALNDQLSALLDLRQEEAQQMFPHYFRRYNTDGVEYNMYIGASLLKDREFDLVYLHNLRLWQLETMWEIEQKACELTDQLSHPLQVASLILIHSNPLAIKFRMDEKQFDVDGAYNARYEIIKKRIDKSYIKGSNERLTQPGRLAIVYAQDKDAQEYMHYLEFLQKEGKYGEVEVLDLEDLQGVSGLKALRVEILYKKKTAGHKRPQKTKVMANG